MMMKSLLSRYILSLVLCALGSTAAAQECSDLFISEYVEGSGSNKALELYNPTDNPIDLSQYKLVRHRNGQGDLDVNEHFLLGTMPPRSIFVLANGQTQPTPENPTFVDEELVALADSLDDPYPAVCYFNGDDAISLQKNVGGNWEYVDIFGKLDRDPGQAWTDRPPYYDESLDCFESAENRRRCLTLDHTLVRKASVKQGVTQNPAEAFNALAEWDTLPRNTFSELRRHECECGTVSRDDISNKRDFIQMIAYPNPVHPGEWLTLSSTARIERAEVYDLRGNHLTTQPHEAGTNTMQLQTSGLAAGLYLVKIVHQGQGIVTYKLSVH